MLLAVNDLDAASDATLFPRRINLFPLHLKGGAAPLEDVRRAFINKARSQGITVRSGERVLSFQDADRMIVNQNPADDIVRMAYSVRFSFEMVGGAMFVALDPTVSTWFRVSVGDLLAMNVPPDVFTDLSVRPEVVQATSERDDLQAAPLFVKGVRAFKRDESGATEFEVTVLDPVAEAESTLSATGLWLIPNPLAIGRVLGHFGKKDPFIQAHRKASLLDGDDLPRKRLKRSRQYAKYLIERNVFPLSMQGMTATLSPSEVSVSDDPFEGAKVLEEPILQFDPEDGSRTHLQPYHGLRNFGPYDRSVPIVNVALLAPANQMSAMRSLVKTLNEGMNSLPGGARKFLHCELKIVGEVNVTGNDAKAFEKAAGFLAENFGVHKPVALCLLPGRTDEDELNTPYYAAKTKLASRGLCAQMVTPERMRNSWAQPDILLGVYAKAGNIPWALGKTDPHCDLIVGVDLSIPVAQNKIIKDHKRFVGTASVFNGRGVWLNQINTHRRYDPGRNAAQLAEIVSGSFTAYCDRFGRAPKATSIHYYKRFGRAERDAVVKEAIKFDPDMKLAFVSIDSSHCMRLFDLSTNDGSYARGGFVPIDVHRFLLATTGDSAIASRKLGTPKILKVTFWQEPAPFLSAEDIANQILGLTKINYKSLTPIQREPVTLTFSADVARLAGAFEVSDWDGAPTAELERKLWFL